MRLLKTAPGEYYHIFNRGMHKQKIFNDQSDYLRFLFQILHFQSPKTFTNITEDAKKFKVAFSNNKHSGFINLKVVNEICQKRGVDLISFCFMPNHFHLIVKEMSGGGVPMYLQRTQNGFTKYLNTRNQTSGHVLQGPYRIVHIQNNDQLLCTSAYVHRNCCELKRWTKTPEKYPWSSYQDYVGKNRWSGLLATNDLLEQFSNPAEYDQWV